MNFIKYHKVDLRAVTLCGQKIIDRDKRLYNLWVVLSGEMEYVTPTYPIEHAYLPASYRMTDRV